MDRKKETLAIVNEDTKILIDTSIILESDLNIGELKLLLYVLDEQLKQESLWVKLDTKYLSEQFNTSEISLARWQKKLKSQALLEQYGVRSLLWRVPKKILRNAEITIPETKIVDLGIEELKEYLNKLQGKNLTVEISYSESLIMKGTWKDFKFYEENIDGESGFIIESTIQKSKTIVIEKEISSSQLITSYESTIKINSITGVTITISDF